MNKKLIALLIALTLFVSIFAGLSVYAAPVATAEFFDSFGDSIVNLTDETEISAKITFTPNKSCTANVVAATFEDDKMSGFNVVATAGVTADELITISVEEINIGDAEEVKLFVWDGFDSVSPLTANTCTIARKVYKPFVEVEPVNGKVAKTVTLTTAGVTALVPAGVVMAEGTKTLGLIVTPVLNSNSGITVGENETLNAIDIHVEGVAKNNTTPIIVTVEDATAIGLNAGNLALYHIENGETVQMTQVSSVEELTAHNSFFYDVVTGSVTLALCSFSEIAMLSDDINAWNGTRDYKWYNTTDREFKIASADQLAGFGAIVGGMAEGIERDTFEGKTVKLIADINIGDDEENNKNNIIFYPIGYYNSTGSYTRTSASVTSNVSSFKGTFDGNGHTIENFYQNTWEMFGDYNDGYSAGSNYYKDAMGLFGYVNGGTVKNLTVKNFSSDGEFTPTGCIAAYAAGNATFENISVFNCNPRVYNTGNGGIVGIAGDTESAENKGTITLKNITVDQSNKISALWGSYDVGCGGLVGMFRGYSPIEFDNCHVAAIMDVNNDVCANYQYYWYRYSGMFIGSVRRNKTDGGYTVAYDDNITATDCTYTMGDWNEYWYCELVANSIASYTHDHQFSRLEKIGNVSEITDAQGNWTRTGNFVIPNADNTAAECYHIMKNSEGKLYRHFHDEADESNPQIYETFDLDGNGKLDDLKEDRTCYYIPFGQVFNGNGYGVKPTYEYEGMTLKEGGTVKSDKKFETTGKTSVVYPYGETTKTIEIGELFDLKVDETKLSKSSLNVFVSPADNTSTVSAVYKADTNNWEKSTLTFEGVGTATVTITDYFYCTPTTITVNVSEGEPEYIDKFKAKEDLLTFTHTIEGGTIEKTLGDVFDATGLGEIDNANVTVTVSNEDLCAYTKNDSDWTKSTLVFTGTGEVTLTITDGELCNVVTATVTVVNPEETEKFDLVFPNTEDYLYRVGNNDTTHVSFSSLFKLKKDIEENSSRKVAVDVITVAGTASGKYNEEKSQINFDGTGVVKVTVDDNMYTTPTELYLEVVDAKNITSAASSDGTDVVLLNDVKVAADRTANYTNCTVYGNGFTFDVCGGMNQYNSKQGHGIIIINGATLDHLRIIGDVYDEYGMYSKDLSGNLQNDYTGAVDATNSTIQNCYIANCAAPIRSNGNTIINTTLYGGTVANLLISGGTNTLTNVTTINYNDDRGVIGMGIVITDGASTDSTKLILNGYLKQHNYVYATDIDEIKVDNAKTVFNSMFENQFSAYHIGSNPKAVNTGIISINEGIDFVNTVFTDNANTGYTVSNDVKVKVSGQGVATSISAAIASVPGTGIVDNKYVENGFVQGDYLPTFTFDLGTQMQPKDNDDDTHYLIGDKNGLSAMYVEGENTLSLDITKLASVSKYTNISYPVTAKCITPDGEEQTGTVSLTAKGTYRLIFTVEDNLFYDAHGNTVNKTVPRTYEVPLVLDVYKKSIADATMTISSSDLTGDYVTSGTNKKYRMYPLKAITSIMDDANKDGVLETFDFKKNIQSAVLTPESNNAFSSPTTITVTYTGGQILTIVLGTPSGLNSPGASNGGKTFSVKTDSTNGIYLQSDGAVASGSAATGTWPLTSWSFKGTSSKVITDNTKVTIKFTKPSSGCLAEGTLITMADGSKKPIEQISYEDELLAWDFHTGSYAVTVPSLIEKHETGEYRILNLNFADDTTVKVVVDHGFFDVEENNFVFIDEKNVDSYIGHNFVKVGENGTYETVELISYDVSVETVSYYSIQTAVYNNSIAENMFTLPAPPEMLDNDEWFNYFEIGNDMKYDEAKMQADIEKYGLYGYEDFKDYVTYEQFIAFNGPYLKVLVGRGVLTYEQILTLISTYVNP